MAQIHLRSLCNFSEITDELGDDGTRNIAALGRSRAVMPESKKEFGFVHGASVEEKAVRRETIISTRKVTFTEGKAGDAFLYAKVQPLRSWPRAMSHFPDNPTAGTLFPSANDPPEWLSGPMTPNDQSSGSH